jgi:hypothetical protein
MKKEEFPTFLNEQPTVAFGRTTRELILILLGVSLAYLVWLLMGHIIPGDDLAARIMKGTVAAIPLAGLITVAFVQIASRPLEIWGIIGLMYFFTPKVFTYDPTEELEHEDDTIDVEIYRLVGQGEARNDW